LKNERKIIQYFTLDFIKIFKQESIFILLSNSFPNFISQLFLYEPPCHVAVSDEDETGSPLTLTFS